MPVKYIFCVSPGRAGSNYLSEVFKHFKNVQSEHEPHPIGNAYEMKQYLKGNKKPMEELSRRKAEKIKAITDSGKVYIESNHCFIKGFGWELPKHIPQEEIGVVIMTRDRQKVLNSHFRIGYTPLSKGGRNWMITPFVDKSLVPFPMSFPRLKFIFYTLVFGILWIMRRLKLLPLMDYWRPDFLKRYEWGLLNWYIEETYARGELYQKTFPNIKYYSTDVMDLNSTDRFLEMAKYFNQDLEPEDSFYDAVSVRKNTANQRIADRIKTGK